MDISKLERAGRMHKAAHKAYEESRWRRNAASYHLPSEGEAFEYHLRRAQAFLELANKYLQILCSGA